MHEPKFFYSKSCGMLLDVIHDGNKPISCCGEEMQVLTANTSEGASEKHLPVVEVNGTDVTVKVGSVYHPMSDEHNIGWIYLQTQQGCQKKVLPVDLDPVVTFSLTKDDRPVAAYAYCNLHGLWKTEL